MPKTLARGVPKTVVSSSARTTSSNSGNLKDTANAIVMGDAVSLIVDMTAQTGDNTPARADIYLDISPDGGTTWLTPLHFAPMTGSTGTQIINFRPTGIGAVEAAGQAWIMTTSTQVMANNFVLPPDHRIRWVLGGTAPTTTFAVYSVTSVAGSGFGG